MGCCEIALTIIIGIGGVALLIWFISASAEEKKKERAAEERKLQDKKREVERLKASIEEDVSSFKSEIATFFGKTRRFPFETEKRLNLLISSVSEKNKKIIELDSGANCRTLFTNFYTIKTAFSKYKSKVDSIPKTRMIDVNHYGKCDASYWEAVRGLSKASCERHLDKADSLLRRLHPERDSGDPPYIENCPVCGTRKFSGKRTCEVCGFEYASLSVPVKKNLTDDEIIEAISDFNDFDLEFLLKCVWFFATEKPYSSQNFERAITLFNYMYKMVHVDTTIARFYALNQIGGEKSLSEQINKTLKPETPSEAFGDLTLLASGLMWMEAYQSENQILQYMLSKKMQMSGKAQERLHALTHGGTNAPADHEVSSNQEQVFFDISAISWRDNEYTAFFDNLMFKEKQLSYSLAVRDEDKELFVTRGVKIPEMTQVLEKIKSIFEEEYGDSVKVSLADCIALSGSGQENLPCVLAVSGDCKQMGILVHLAQIGKKISIKFYTLLMPTSNDISETKQQALSLSNKLSPTITTWESSMKENMLVAIQQLLNTTTQPGGASPISGSSKSF